MINLPLTNIVLKSKQIMRWPFLLVFIGVFFIGSTAMPQVQPTITYEYYSVRPKAGQSIYKQMFEDSTIMHRSRKVVAITDWDIKYTCNYKSVGSGKCAIDEYDVRSICKITLPKLISDERNINDAFNEYIPHLRNHEMYHCQIATDYANYLDGQLKALGPMECQVLKATVKKIRNQAIREAKKAHKLFDQQTLANRKNFHAGKYFLADLFPQSRVNPE